MTKRIIRQHTRASEPSDEKHGIVTSLSHYNRYLESTVGTDLNIDEHGETHSSIADGWKGISVLWGIITAGAGLMVAKHFGFDILELESKSTALIIAKAIAGLAALANLISWASNPGKDLATLQEWLTTMPNRYKANNYQRWLILLQMLLITSICVTVVINPIYAACIGILAYTNNTCGFVIIHGKVQRALVESRRLCHSLAPSEIQGYLMRGYQIIDAWWGCSVPFLRNPMQRRHLSILLGFCLVLLISGFGVWTHSTIATLLSYYASAIVLFGAVVSITIMRTKRDNALEQVESDWSTEMIERVITQKSQERKGAD